MELREGRARQDQVDRRRAVLHAADPDAARRAALQAVAHRGGATDQHRRAARRRTWKTCSMSKVLPQDISEIRSGLQQIIREVVGSDLGEIDEETPLLDYVTSSLALLQGIRMVYDKYGVLIPIRPLLEGAGNLRALSAYVDQALRAHEKSLHAAVARDAQAHASYPRLALAPGQRHVGFLARYSAGASEAYNEPLAVRLNGALHGPAMQAAFEAVVQRYEAARATLDINDDAVFFGE